MKMYKLMTIVVILTVAASLAGCSKGTDGTVLAKVNRGAITTADFKKQLEGADAPNAAGGGVRPQGAEGLS